MLIGCVKHATSMLQALKDVGFIDSDGFIHDWDEHEGYHRVYSERAKTAANALWSQRKAPIPPKNTEDKDKEIGNRRQACVEHASSMQEASPNLNGPGQKPKSIEECLITAQQIGLPASDARQWFIDCEAAQWRRGDGTRFDNWVRQMTIHRDQTRERALKLKGNGSVSASAQAVLDKTDLERTESEIKRIEDSVDSHRDLPAEDRTRRKQLKDHAEILKRKLGFAA